MAIQWLRQEGAIISTSESVLFQLQHDAGTPGFKAFSGAVKDAKEGTASALKELRSTMGSPKL